MNVADRRNYQFSDASLKQCSLELGHRAIGTMGSRLLNNKFKTTAFDNSFVVRIRSVERIVHLKHESCEQIGLPRLKVDNKLR